MRMFLFVLLFGISLCRSNTQAEEEAKKETVRKDSPAVAAISTIGLGLDLAEYGRKHKSSIVLLAAAEIIGKQQKRPLTAAKVLSGDNSKENTPTSSQAKPAQTLTSERLLQEARHLAKNDKAILQLIERLDEQLSEKTRGFLFGPRWARVTCPLNGFWRWNGVIYKGNERAVIMLKGEGITDLDLKVYDIRGRLVVSDVDREDFCRVTWIPRVNTPYNIVVINRGSKGNDFTIVTN